MEETHTASGDAREEAVNPWRPVLEQAPVDPWREKSKLEQDSLVGLVTPWGPILEQFVKKCNPFFTLKNFVEDSLLWEGPHTGGGDRRTPLPQEEAAAEKMR